MQRLIDADSLLKELRKSCEYHAKNSRELSLLQRDIIIVQEQPTIDTVPQWIPCGERLPEAPFGCLVTVEDEEPMTGALFPNLLPYFVGWDGEQWNDADGEQCPFEVLAWMPLPEPYEVNHE